MKHLASWLPVMLTALSLAACDRQPELEKANSAAVDTSASKTKSPRWPFVAESPIHSNSTETDASVSLQRNYYVVFDASGSMTQSKCSGNESKLAVAKRALVEFTQKLPADANFGLSVFDSRGVHEVMPIATINKHGADRAIAMVEAGGGTPLAEAIQKAYAALTEQGRKQLGYGDYNLVVVTDGEATGPDPRKIVDAVLRESPIVLHTVGFCIGDTHSLNQPGRVVYRAADNPAELSSGLADVLAEAPTFDAKSFK
jgi:Ca-activated chloride channel homolog